MQEPKCEVVEAEAKMCKTSSQTAAMPEDWQATNVTHRYGQGSEGNPRNYRHMNLASFLSTHLEELVINVTTTEITKTWINIV